MATTTVYFKPSAKGKWRTSQLKDMKILVHADSLQNTYILKLSIEKERNTK